VRVHTIQSLPELAIKPIRDAIGKRQLVQATASELLSVFREPYLAGNRALNEGDFKRAYAALPDDFEYNLALTWPNVRPLHGPDEIVPFFEDFHETFPDVRTQITVTELIPIDQRTMVTGFEVTGTGRTSGARVEMEIWQVWEFDERMLPRRLVEFHDRSAAFDAARDEAPARRDD
jgi:SnoaL-like protein